MASLANIKEITYKNKPQRIDVVFNLLQKIKNFEKD
jgi:hypothetical protein